MSRFGERLDTRDSKFDRDYSRGFHEVRFLEDGDVVSTAVSSEVELGRVNDLIISVTNYKGIILDGLTL